VPIPGPGGEVTTGLDEGHLFTTARAGFGFGGGAEFDPTGGMPITPSNHGGSGVIRSITWKFDLTLSLVFVGFELGVAYDSREGFEPVQNFDPLKIGPDAHSGFKIGTSVGGQLTAYGSPAPAITSTGTCRAHF
jgi:hypothetical protein